MTKPNEVDHYIGIRIRFFRRARRMSQTALGLMLELTYQQVQKYERAKCRVPATRLYRIAQILDIPLDAFFPNPSCDARRLRF